VIWLLSALAVAAGAYQILVLLAAVRFVRRRPAQAGPLPPVSILKPVHGLDPHFYEAIRSHALQDYPAFEILFGTGDPDDPAAPEIRRLAAEFPDLPIRFITASQPAANQKVGVLAELAANARHPVLVVNDSDIAVPPDYVRLVVAPLQDPRVGMVTCLYRGEARGLAARLECLAIATEFAPGVLAAPLVGVSEFALGSTMAFRAADLQRIGGFRSIADYLADDYQLSRRIHELGLKVVISRPVVTTFLPERGWREAWRHQVRWARTIRVCRGGGYLGMPVTVATLWAVLLACAGRLWEAAALLVLRLAAAIAVAGGVLGVRLRLSDLLLIPLRDLWGLAVWVAGLGGRTVHWRGRRLQISRDGRICGADGCPPR